MSFLLGVPENESLWSTCCLMQHFEACSWDSFYLFSFGSVIILTDLDLNCNIGKKLLIVA